MSSPRAIFWRVPPLILLGCVLLAVGAMATNPGQAMHLYLIGPILGTLMQQVVLAATWAAVGPGHWLIRLPISLGWACLVAVAVSVPMAFKDHNENPHEIVVFMALLWLAAQVPVWGVSRFFGLRLRHQPTYVPEENHRDRQFGIGQLMIFTAGVSVLLGVGRLLVASQLVTDSMENEFPFVIFLLTAQLIISLPLIIASLMPRHVALGVIVSLLLMAGLTVAEIPLAQNFSPGGTEDKWIFGLLNLCSALWVLAFAAVVRWNGYHFGVPQRSSMIIQPTETPEP